MPFKDLLIAEVPACDVVVEPDAVCAAELGDDVHNLSLLLWREHVFTMMNPIIRAVTSTEEGMYTLASL